jgi:segregation and condensation protein B
MTTLEKQLEAILFYKGEPEKRSTLAKLLEITTEELENVLHLLAASLADRGVRLLTVNDEVELVTAPETSQAILRLRKNELTRDLGKAGSETLAIILYRGPLSRAQLDYIRGVNSTFIVRNLEVRGLVERIPNPDNKRQTLLRGTAELTRHLGLTSLDDLPNREKYQTELAAFEERKEEHEATLAAEHGVTQEEPATTQA